MALFSAYRTMCYLNEEIFRPHLILLLSHYFFANITVRKPAEFINVRHQARSR